MNETIIRKAVPYKALQQVEGLHLIEVVLTDEGVFRARQMQRVGDRWTTTGCNWYSDVEMRQFGETALRGTFGEIVDQGQANLVEYDDENLRGYQFLARSDGMI